MKLDDQIRTLPTLAGLISTICVILVVSSYSMIQFEKLVLKEGEDILETTKEDFFDDTHELTFEDGINFAVGLSSFDTNTEPILDPQYGELVFIKRRWKFSQEEGDQNLPRGLLRAPQGSRSSSSAPPRGSHRAGSGRWELWSCP